jgi:hypothetical protein
MKLIQGVTSGLLLTVLYVNAIFAQGISITIDQITANEQIMGCVRGLASTDRPNYKVIVYVHTDQWYIHPYAGQGEGMSWAPIRENGSWQIRTVQREFKADKVAALLVKRNYPEPSKIESLERIPHRAIVTRELRGTPDYGKL